MGSKYRIELKGVFYTAELYDSKGREVYDSATAVEVAEELYGDSWTCVYNGQYAVTRDEHLATV